jgi:methionine-rich copper-binding protein CopC
MMLASWTGLAISATVALDKAQPAVLQPGETLTLTWAQPSGGEFVNVYYSSDQGATWWLMARDAFNTGQFATFVPNHAGSATFKIIDSQNGKILSTSQPGLSIAPPSIAAIQTITMEAEDGVLTGPMKVAINGQAFNNRTVHGYHVNRRGNLELTVNVPVAGTYAIWARVLGMNDIANSFYVSVDNGTEYWWDLKKNNKWEWDRISDRGPLGTYEGNAQVDPVLFNLTAGTHLLRLRNREKNTQVDQIRITNDLNAGYTDGPTTWIDLTAPQFAQIVPFGQPCNVTWQSQNLAGKVNIDLSMDQGATFGYSIAKDTDNDGLFVWNVPTGMKLAKALLRVASAANGGIPQDVNWGYFAIVDPAGDNRQIIVTSPNGGESLTAGDTYFVNWTMKNYWGNVNIYYSMNNGAAWQTISYNRDGSRDQFDFDWLVPNTPSTQCLIKIADADADFPFDVSNATFTILPGSAPTAFVELLAPNGSEKYAVGSVQHVIWESNNYTGLIQVELSTDNGKTWTRIASDQPASKYWDWVVPNTLSTNCKMRVFGAGGQPESYTANTFSIVAAGIVTPPPPPPPPPTVTDFALSFDGVNDIVQVANNATLNIAKKFTIEFWLKTAQPTQNWGRILEKGMWDEYSVSFYGTKAKMCACLVAPVPGSYARMTVTHGPSTTALAANAWYHVAMTYDGATAKLFINGKEEFSKALASVTPRSLTKALIIGAARQNDTIEYPFKGVLDEIRLWNVARTGTQILGSATASLTGTETGLVAYYPLNEGTGQTVEDKSANTNNGTMGTSAAVDASDPTWVASDRPATIVAKQPVATPTDESSTVMAVPEQFQLYANYPNPFNIHTTIRFALAESRNAQLAVYDVTGRLIRQYAMGTLEAGEHQLVWDGLNENGQVVTSGVYFYRLTAGDWSETQRMLVIK